MIGVALSLILLWSGAFSSKSAGTTAIEAGVGGGSRNCNKGHKTDAYQSTHHTLVLLYQYNFTEGNWL
jgi:hypothetical protein